MSAKLPGSLETLTREPLDGKYWIETLSDLDTGLTFQGLMRFDKSTDKLYIKLSSDWVEIPLNFSDLGATVAIRNVTSGPIASVRNVGTASHAVFDFVLPKGDTGRAATVTIDRIELSPDGYGHVQNIGTATDAQYVLQLPAGPQGIQGKSFTIDAQDLYANIGTYADAPLGFVFLDEKGFVYIKESTGWSKPIPFQGPQGATGKSVYLAYSAFSTGSGASFVLSPVHKFVSILTKNSQPQLSEFTTWVRFVGQDGGPAGASAYETWLSLGNSGTEEEFVDSLRGNNGKSAYQIWLDLGNTGTEQEFLNSLGRGYTLPTASSSTLGGIKIGNRLSSSGGVVSADNQVQNSLIPASTTLAPSVDVVVGELTALKAPITGRFPNGHREAFDTAQLAATALYAAGGGVIISEIDIIGPLTLQGNVSLYAPNKKIYNDDLSSNDVLTLYNHSGSVQVGEIVKTSGVWAYAVKVNGGSPTLKANITCSRGYNALFLSGGATTFEGNVVFSNDTTGPAGERIAVLAVSATLKMVGDITVASSDTATEGLTSFSNSSVDYTGTIKVLSKGSLGRTQSAYLSVRGRGISADRGFKWFLGKADVYMSIDTRTSSNPTGANSAFTMQVNGAANGSEFLILHAGCELLVPTSIPSIFSVSGQALVVKTTSPMVQTSLPDSHLIIQQLGVGGIDKSYVDSADNNLQTQINNITVGTGSVTGDAVEAVIVDSGDVRMDPDHMLYLNNAVIQENHIIEQAITTPLLANESVTLQKLNSEVVVYINELQSAALANVELDVDNIQSVQLPLVKGDIQGITTRVAALESYTPLSLTISGQELTLHADSGDSTVTLPSGGGTSTSSPKTADTLIWLDAGNAFATNKGIAGAFQVDNGTTFRTNPTGLNGLPTVLLNNSSAGNLDPSLILYGNNFVKSGPGTFTILCKCTSSVNSDLTNVDGKRLLQYDFDVDFALNYQSFVTNSSAGASVNVGNAWTVATIQFPFIGNGFVYVNGLYYTVTGDRNYMFSTSYGGHIRLFGSFVGEIAEVLVSRDASRETGRLHEQYLKTKYNLTF